MDITMLIGIGGVPIVVGLVEVMKKFVTDDRFWPLFAIAYGILWNTIAALATKSIHDQSDLANAILVGVVIGLAAAGLYSGSRTMLSR